MKLKWLVANQAFVVVFGDDIVPVDGRRFFTTREGVAHALATVGLKAEWPSGRVVLAWDD